MENTINWGFFLGSEFFLWGVNLAGEFVLSS